MAQDIEALTEPADILFGEAFGLIGFFTNRAFINGDGVVNSPDYLEYRAADGVHLAQYLDRERVTYVFGNVDGRIIGDSAACTLVKEWKNTDRGHLGLCRRTTSLAEARLPK